MKRQEKIKVFAIEKLKSKRIEDEYNTKPRNRFQALEEKDNIDQNWYLFKQAVLTNAEEVIRRKPGSNRKRWIKDETWNLID